MMQELKTARVSAYLPSEGSPVGEVPVMARNPLRVPISVLSLGTDLEHAFGLAGVVSVAQVFALKQVGTGLANVLGDDSSKLSRAGSRVVNYIYMSSRNNEVEYDAAKRRICEFTGLGLNGVVLTELICGLDVTTVAELLEVGEDQLRKLDLLDSEIAETLSVAAEIRSAKAKK